MRFLIAPWRDRNRLKAARRIIGASSLFDASWYAQRYPDVRAAGIDPLDHFITYGGGEGRNPGPHFSSRWYLDIYPDIRVAGLNPLLHYLEHGRDEGRQIKSLADAGSVEEQADGRKDEGDGLNAYYTTTPIISELEANRSSRRFEWRTMLGGGQRHRRWRRGMPLEINPGKPAISIGEEVLAVHDPETSSTLISRLILFSALRRDLPVANRGLHLGGSSPPIFPDAVDAHRSLIAAGLGLSLVADGWFTGDDRLYIRLGAQQAAGVLRAYQFSPIGDLRCCGEIPVGGTGVDVVELRIEHQLSGLLLTTTSDDGQLHGVAIMPFPSLLRGGLHHSELAAIESAPSSFRTLVDYSHSLALEFFGWPDGPESFSIGELLVDLCGATGTEFLFRPDLIAALGAQYAIGVRPLKAPQPGAMLELTERLSPDCHLEAITARRATGAALILPADALPSLYSLVSRRAGGRSATSSFCVADAATLLPRALVCLPVSVPGLTQLQHPALPVHFPILDSERETVEEAEAPAAALAVRYCNPLSWQFDPLMPIPPDQTMPLPVPENVLAGDQPLITAIVDLTHGDDDPGQIIASLSAQMMAERIDLVLVGGKASDDDLRTGLASVRYVHAEGASPAASINILAARVVAPYLLLLDPRAVLADFRIVATLIAMAGQPGVGTAACAMVSQNVDETGVHVHSAGYFPAHMALWGDPALTLDQLDVAAFLPAATYPVIANHMKCCVVPTGLWRELGGLDASRFPVAHFDLDFGYRVLSAGCYNYCTTLVRAAIAQPEPDADFPDPIGHRLVQPAQWQSVFERVTAIRELRR